MGDENIPVTKDLCKVIHKQVDERLDDLNACIKEIRDAVNEMREIAASNKEILNILMEERANRMQSIPKEMPKKHFLEMPWSKYVIITACFVIVLLVGGAVGSNILDHYIQVMGGVIK